MSAQRSRFGCALRLASLPEIGPVTKQQTHLATNARLGVPQTWTFACLCRCVEGMGSNRGVAPQMSGSPFGLPLNLKRIPNQAKHAHAFSLPYKCLIANKIHKLKPFASAVPCLASNKADTTTSPSEVHGQTSKLNFPSIEARQSMEIKPSIFGVHSKP